MNFLIEDGREVIFLRGELSLIIACCASRTSNNVTD